MLSTKQQFWGFGNYACSRTCLPMFHGPNLVMIDGKIKVSDICDYSCALTQEKLSGTQALSIHEDNCILPSQLQTNLSCDCQSTRSYQQCTRPYLWTPSPIAGKPHDNTYSGILNLENKRWYGVMPAPAPSLKNLKGRYHINNNIEFPPRYHMGSITSLDGSSTQFH
jgi:hypothetical protein